MMKTCDQHINLSGRTFFYVVRLDCFDVILQNKDIALTRSALSSPSLLRIARADLIDAFKRCGAFAMHTEPITSRSHTHETSTFRVPE
jgi:hypothetical protein